jgi:hypothetical protein
MTLLGFLIDGLRWRACFFFKIALILGHPSRERLCLCRRAAGALFSSFLYPDAIFPSTETQFSSEKCFGVAFRCPALHATQPGHGPILQIYAKKYGVILSDCDGDEPGVQMNLFRWVRGLGLTP